MRPAATHDGARDGGTGGPGAGGYGRPMEHDPARPVLWHLAMSHYNEKARWALDVKRLPHTRRAALPGFHVLIAKRLAGTDTFPILVAGDDVYADSTDIIAALERMVPDPPLYPDDPQERTAALELEDGFDRRLAPAVRRVAYQYILADPPTAQAMLASGGPPERVRALELMFGPLSRAMRSAFRVPEEDDDTQVRALRAEVDRLGDLVDGRTYLVGDTFTVADLTAAAFLAPLVCVDAMPIDLPPRPPALEALAQELRATPGGAWAEGIYRSHRF